MSHRNSRAVLLDPGQRCTFLSKLMEKNSSRQAHVDGRQPKKEWNDSGSPIAWLPRETASHTLAISTTFRLSRLEAFGPTRQALRIESMSSRPTPKLLRELFS